MRTLLALLLTLAASPVLACPFCAAESRTLTEEMNDASVTLLAKLTTPSEAASKLANSGVPYQFVDPETGSASFSVERILFGEDLMTGVTQIEAIYFGEPDTERSYLIRGVGDPPDWAIPLPLSEIAAEYVPKLLDLPAEGADRLDFFQQYLEHEDPLLGQDAYDEFARAPYQDVIDLGPRMDREQLREWIEDYSVSPSRRRLFLTMLGVCGEAEDLDRLRLMLTSDNRVLGPAAEAGAAAAMAVGGSPAQAMTSELVRFGERQRKLGLDALIACYLTLAGKHGDASQALDLIDDRFLKDPDADYSHVYAALQALRFLAEEQQELVPLDRLLVSARLLLNNPDFADQVIPDLARWEDWTVLEQLADMFRRSFDEEDETAPVRYVREPIITYLDVAAELEGDLAERAKKALAEVEPLDPDAVKRARSLRAFGFLAQARAKRDAGDLPEIDAAVALPGGANATNALPTDRMAPVEKQAEPEEIVAEAPPAEAPPEKPAVAAAAAPPEPAVTGQPPSRSVLIGVPLLSAVALVGLFWLVLRGGVG